MQRWIYADRSVPEESSYYRDTIRRIDAWWDAFKSRHGDIAELFSGKNEEWNLVAWMEEHLQGIDARLMWEFGPAVDGPGDRLVITPEYQVFLRPLVDTILERAPKIEGWEFYSYRLAEGLEQTSRAVEGKCGGDISDLRVAVDPGSDGLVDLVFVSARTANEEELNQRRNEAFVTTEVLLGEMKLDRWIGVVDVIPESQAGEWEVISLSELATEVDRHVNEWRSQLPTDPCADWIDQDTEWGCWEINHNPSGEGPESSSADGNDAEGEEWALGESEDLTPEDYPRRQDMFVVISGFAKLTNAIFNGRAIYSECFTNSGESFCFLKIDGIDGLDDSRFSDRGEIEDALNNALKPERIGCVIGGGSGHRYSYVDLALLSLPIGIEVIQRVLRAGKIPRRTWLLFFDTPLEAEWIGLYQDTPPPPRERGEPWGGGGR